MVVDLDQARLSRRNFLRKISKGVSCFLLGGLIGKLLSNSPGKGTVWQIDPEKCVQCGKCATNCVLKVSAVRCMHKFSLCGYCRLCFGYFTKDYICKDEGAENQLCPTGAIIRRFIEEPYYEYTIKRDLCIGCGRCVKGCNSFGNGSLYLQIQRDICIDCNECSIAPVCDGKAIARIPGELQYIPKKSHV